MDIPTMPEGASMVMEGPASEMFTWLLLAIVSSCFSWELEALIFLVDSRILAFDEITTSVAGRVGSVTVSSVLMSGFFSSSTSFKTSKSSSSKSVLPAVAFLNCSRTFSHSSSFLNFCILCQSIQQPLKFGNST